MGRSPYIWVCERVEHRRAWHGILKAQGVVHWPAQLSEAQVGAMQAEGLHPDAMLTRWDRAVARWLPIVNPPAPERDPRD